MTTLHATSAESTAAPPGPPESTAAPHPPSTWEQAGTCTACGAPIYAEAEWVRARAGTTAPPDVRRTCDCERYTDRRHVAREWARLALDVGGLALGLVTTAIAVSDWWRRRRGPEDPGEPGEPPGGSWA